MLLINLFLLLNGLLYITLGLWCAIRPQQTASSVGLTWESIQGLVEYVTVYGGLEFALGVFFLYCALRPDYAGAGVVFGLCLYGGLAIFRTIALGVHGSAIGNGYLFYAIEVGMLVFAIFAARKLTPPADLQIPPAVQMELPAHHSLSQADKYSDPAELPTE